MEGSGSGSGRGRRSAVADIASELDFIKKQVGLNKAKRRSSSKDGQNGKEKKGSSHRHQAVTNADAELDDIKQKVGRGGEDEGSYSPASSLSMSPNPRVSRRNVNKQMVKPLLQQQPHRQASSGLGKLHLSQENNTARPRVSAHPEWAMSGCAELDTVQESPAPKPTKPMSGESYHTATSEEVSIISEELNNIKHNGRNRSDFLKAQRQLMQAAMHFTHIANGGKQQPMFSTSSESESFYQTIWETTFECIAITNSKGLIKYVNPSMLSEFRYDYESQIVGQDISVLAGSEVGGGGDDDDDEQDQHYYSEEDGSIDKSFASSGSRKFHPGEGATELGEVEILHSRRNDGTEFLSLVGVQKYDLNNGTSDDNRQEKSKEEEGDTGDDDDLIFFIRNISNYANTQKVMAESSTVKEQVDQIDKLQTQVDDLEGLLHEQDDVISNLENKTRELEDKLISRFQLVSAIKKVLDIDDESIIVDEIDNILDQLEEKEEECERTRNVLEKQIKNQAVLAELDASSSQLQLEQQQELEMLRSENASVHQQQENEQIDHLASENEKLLKEKKAMQKYIDTLEEGTVALTSKLDEVTRSNEELASKPKVVEEVVDQKDDNNDDVAFMEFMDDLADTAITSDADGKILHVNGVTLTMFGYKNKGDIEGKNLSFLVGDKTHQKFVDGFKSASSTGPYSLKQPLAFGRKSNGKEFPCSICLKRSMSSPFASKNNLLVGIIRDMSSLRGKTIPFEPKATRKGIPIANYTVER